MAASAALALSPTQPAPGARPADPTLRGIACVVASTVFFSGSDVLTKALSAGLPAVEIAWMRYLVFSALVLPFLLRAGGRRPLASARPGLQVLRGLGMVGSALLFTEGLRYLPVAEATAMNFVSPIFIMALSIPVLGESVGWRRWTAALVGLGGVLIVIRPGAGAFDPAALFPVLAAASWATAAVVTRKTGGLDGAATTMGYSALTGLVVLTLLLPFGFEVPTGRELLLGLGVGILSTIGHGFIVLAYRHALASVVAPFSYVQLIGAGILSYLAFGAVPDRWTLAGAAVIALSGLYIAHRERVRARG